jgi:hypothetical protein
MPASWAASTAQPPIVPASETALISIIMPDVREISRFFDRDCFMCVFPGDVAYHSS